MQLLQNANDYKECPSKKMVKPMAALTDIFVALKI